VLFAKWSSALLIQQLATWRGSVFLDLSLDWRVLAFTAGLAAATAAIAGIVPALSVTGVAPGDAMKESSRTITGDRRLSIRGALVVAQIALSLVLIVGAGLFLRTFAALNATPLGFAAGGLTVATVNLPAAVSEPAARRDLVDRIDAAMTSAPGVRAASLSVIAPITGSGWNDQIGSADGPPTAAKRTWVNAVTPEWFRTMGIRQISGRGFDRGDRLGAPPVTIVNETFARRFLAGRPPVGQRVTAGGPRDRQDFEVVGVVSDAVYRSLREGVVPTMYMPLAAQESVGSRITLIVSTSTAARSTADRLLGDTLHGVDPELTFSIRDFDQFIRGGLTQERLVAMLSGFFGGLALLLAAVGLYGVVAHAVDVRRTEIGVRIALGADRVGILVLVFRRVAVMLVLGLAAGLGLSLWASRFVGALLFRLEPRDVSTFTGALAVLIAASALAAWIPARRASRIDPAQVLREG
jgi:putative ABC transport system permease protein